VYMMYYSDYSAPVMYTTAVAAPSQPDPPMLSEQFVTALTVSWIRRPGDDVFTLNMDDESKVRTSICQKCLVFFIILLLLSGVVFHIMFAYIFLSICINININVLYRAIDTCHPSTAPVMLVLSVLH